MAEQQTGSITIVGLGPGSADLITRRSWETIQRAQHLYLRTARHPAVAGLPPHLQPVSFDPIYEAADDFAAVYSQIAARLVAAAQDGAHAVYAVPGDPATGESTVTAIVEQAARLGIPCEVQPGVSFLQPLLAALQLDALDGVQLFDAISVAGYNYPPVNPDIPLVLGQVYSRLVANDLKLSLMAVYPDEHAVTLVHDAGLAQQRLETVPLYEIDRSTHIGIMTSLYVPTLPRAASLPALAETAAVLRSPEGCPWDREQTPQSLRPHLAEEVAELLEALDADDPHALQEELGDVLFHLVMLAQMAREEELFRLPDAIAGIDAKLHHRHPHVWGDQVVRDSAEVVENWEAIKAVEKGHDAARSLLDGIPQTLSALARSQNIQERVRRVGFDWPDITGVYDKLHEELQELQHAATPPERAAEAGDLLFAAVNLARWLDADAESALREANARFSSRFRRLEQLARDRNIDLAQADLDMLEQLWQEAKALLWQEGEG